MSAGGGSGEARGARSSRYSPEGLGKGSDAQKLSEHLSRATCGLRSIVLVWAGQEASARYGGCVGSWACPGQIVEMQGRGLGGDGRQGRSGRDEIREGKKGSTVSDTRSLSSRFCLELAGQSLTQAEEAK